MNLADTQRTLARYCLSPTPDPADAAALGGPDARWALYRSMVRGRFAEIVGDALPRTRAALGTAGFQQVTDGFLATAPPTTRFARELGDQWAAYLLAVGAPPGAPPWVLDMARYERCRLHVAVALDTPAVAPVDFTMSAPAVCAPAHAVVRLAWDVHREDVVDEHAQGTHPVLVYRHPDSHRVGVLVLSPIAADVVEALATGEGSVTDSVRGVLARHDAAPGAVFIESLADLLGELMDRGVLLGSREV